MERVLRYKPLVTIMSWLALTMAPSFGNAQVVAAPASAFPISATLLTFNGLADGVEVNGLVIGGITFSYSLGNGNVLIDGGPGTTNNVDPQNAVSFGNPTGIMTLTLPGLYDMFGFGYALLTVGTVPSATTITAFNGATSLGSVPFTASNDPDFSGGFAGIQSVTPFNRVQFVFDPGAPAFAFDNVRLNASSNLSTVPEPSTNLLIGAGLLAIGGGVRRKRRVTWLRFR